MIARKIVVCLVISLFFAWTVLSVSAKSYPYIEEADADWGDVSAPLPVFSPDASLIHAGHLDRYNDVDAFVFSFDAPNPNWEVGLVVASCGQHYEAVYPTLALIGVGVEVTDSEIQFEVAEGTGVQLFEEAKTDGKRSTTFADRFMGAHSYVNDVYELSIPAAGDYILAVYEPHGNMGAYMLATGSNNDEFPKLPNDEVDSAFDSFLSGDWVRQDCKAPVATENCPVTDGPDEGEIPSPPERFHVGEGFVLTGIVRDSTTCLPMTNAEVVFWLVNEQGDYDEAHEGKTYTNDQGMYWVESNRPGAYGPPPHIHLVVSAPECEPVFTEFILTDDTGDTATMDIALEAAH